MENSEAKSILDECKQLLKNCDAIIKENEEMKRCVDFLINEYKTNKRYFRLEPGIVTIEDVIKTAFEFGWDSKSNYEYNNNKVEGQDTKTSSTQIYQ